MIIILPFLGDEEKIYVEFYLRLNDKGEVEKVVDFNDALGVFAFYDKGWLSEDQGDEKPDYTFVIPKNWTDLLNLNVRSSQRFKFILIKSFLFLDDCD